MTAATPPGEPPAAELLTRFLAGRDVPCPVCRYNLRDLTGTRCPECGLELRLAIGAAGARFGLLVFALVPRLMMLGLSVAPWILSLDGPPSARLWGIWVVMILGPVEGLFALWLYRRRVWFLRRSRRVQWILALAAWVVNAAAALVAVLNVFGEL
jgi:hypothetical protein